MTAFLVKLEDELHRSRVTGLFLNIKSLPGVEFVADMAVVSQETLDAILLKPEAEPVAKPKRRKPRVAA